MRRIAVMIMAKAPQAGAVKTRLCPPLSPDEATALYDCFLRDKVAQVRALHAAQPAIAYTPPESRDFFEVLAPHFLLLPQQGTDLSTRLMTAFEALFTAGYDGVIATDSDSPTLPVAFLQQAVDQLAKAQTDVVLGPSEDGGYYLIGLRQMYPALFEAMPWSTPQVFTETRCRAEAQGLTLACLPAWFDIDTGEDLERLRHQLPHLGDAAPHATQQFFATHKL